jgi:hypothetical protein
VLTVLRISVVRLFGSLVLAAFVVALGGCGGEARSVTSEGASPSSDGFTIEECRKLIPEEVIESLGWTSHQEMDVNLTRCKKVTEQGSVTVQRLAESSGGQTGEAASSSVFEKACGEIGDSSGSEIDISSAADTCSSVVTDRAGTSILVVLTPDGHIAEVRIGALVAIPESTLTSTAQLLGRSAVSILDGS